MKRRITKRVVDSLKPGDWVTDTDIPGFAARCLDSGRKIYLIRYRIGRGKNARRPWFTLGTHGAPLTPVQARKEAIRVLGRVHDGADPVAEREEDSRAQIVAQLCDDYLVAAEKGRILTRRGAPKKASTLATDRGRIARHIKPLLGHLKVRDVSRKDVTRFRDAVREGKTVVDVKTKPRGRAMVKGGAGTATRTLGLLGGIFAFAVREGLRPDNPVHGVERDADKHRERRLSPAEYVALGKSLRAYEQSHGAWPAAAAIRTMALTGCRKGEVQGLLLAEVEADSLRLIDSKSGASLRPLGGPASRLLSSVPTVEGSPYVFPATRGEGHYQHTPKVFGGLVQKARLKGVTLHTLRHSFASVANDLGYSEATIGAMLGHSTNTTTGRYVHHLDQVLIGAADKVSRHIADLLDGSAKGDADVVPIPRKRRA